MIQRRHIISIAIVHSVCDGKGDYSMPCLMGSWTSQPTVGQEKKSYEKVFFLQKEAGWPYNFFGAADWPTLHNLCSYFALNSIIDNYDIYINMVIYPADHVHLAYGFILIN